MIFIIIFQMIPQIMIYVIDVYKLLVWVQVHLDVGGDWGAEREIKKGKTNVKKY